MRLSSVIGLLIGLIAIFGSFIIEGGTLGQLFVPPAILIVFGGTIAAGIIGSSLRQVLRLPQLIRLTILPPSFNTKSVITEMTVYAVVGRKEGILSLERFIETASHPYLRKLLRTAIDGADPDTIRSIVEMEMERITERHMANIGFLKKLGGYSPTMGIIGTVMGLISTLANAGSDPNELIRHIATAFIATLWGIFMANIVWLPLADKLKLLHDEEMSYLDLMLEGMAAVQMGESPTVLRSRLVGALPLSEQEGILAEPVPTSLPQETLFSSEQDSD